MTNVGTEMTQKVVFAYETDYLDDVWGSMQSMGIRHVPILRGHQLVGILSDRDLLKIGQSHGKDALVVPHRQIGPYMTKEVITCKISDSIASVANTFVRFKIDALPVLSEREEFIGIITSTDLLRMIADRAGNLLHDMPFPWDPESLRKEYWRPDAQSC